MLVNKFALSKQEQLLDFIKTSHYCDLCTKCKNQTVYINENINAKVLFVVDFPADTKSSLGFNKESYNNFISLLCNVGWKRTDVFLAYSILCSPTESSSDLSDKIQNCSFYLGMIINLVRPEVLITLGDLALKSISLLKEHNINLVNDVSKTFNWNGYKLIPLFHPNPNSSLHRSLPKQRSDYIMLSKYVDPSTGLNKNKKHIIRDAKAIKVNNDSVVIISSLLKELKEISLFKLTKLLYFLDLLSLERNGFTLTGSIYLRQQNGPWSPDLIKIIKHMDGNEISMYTKKIPYIKLLKLPRENTLDENIFQLINEVIKKYGSMSEKNIKIAAYRSYPMRYVLEQEKLNRDMRRIPLLYKNKTVIDLDNQV